MIYLILGYLVLLILSILSVKTLVVSLFAAINRSILVRIIGGLLAYYILDHFWFIIYDSHFSFVAIIILVLPDFFHLNDEKLTPTAKINNIAEVISGLIFGVYTLIFVEFNWI